jgi:DNA replication initiation complex subunit (GINS family)
MRNSILDRIQELHRAEPFRPFEISFDDGRRVLIDRPEFLGVFSDRDRIFFSTLEDTTEVADVDRVARVEPAESRPRRRGKE